MGQNHERFAKIAVKSFLASHVVTVLPTLAAARMALMGGSFDLIMIDYDLDDGKGDELTAQVAVLSPRPPIIATSAHALGNQRILEAGADAVCAKTDFANIARVIAEVQQS